MLSLKMAVEKWENSQAYNVKSKIWCTIPNYKLNLDHANLMFKNYT